MMRTTNCLTIDNNVPPMCYYNVDCQFFYHLLPLGDKTDNPSKVNVVFSRHLVISSFPSLTFLVISHLW